MSVRFAGCLLFLSLCSINTTLPAQQHQIPPDQQKRIDDDVVLRVGDISDNPGPLAKGLSSKNKPKDVEAAIRKVADWQLQAQPYFGNEWTWSVLYTGFMAASDATGDMKYRDAMMGVGEKFNWKLRSHLPNADDSSIGQTYTELYMQKHDPQMIANTRDELDALYPLEKDARGRIPWWWCDALFMGPPVWVRMYAITQDVKYLGYIDREWWKTSELLYDPEEHLYFRDATYLKKTEENGQKMFWSRGNGWVMGGFVRVLQYYPKNRPEREKYIRQFTEMAAKLASLQGKDGLWRSGLLDPDYYGVPENSGSALITYGLAYGVNEGILDSKTYRPVVERAWKGLLSYVYADGRLGSIQQVGAAPSFFRPSSSWVYGVGGFLLAGSEIDRMAKGGKRQ
ncbi:MAG TPA: glycoside hydrolase family 88 protein [Pseudacidobacterium sp.]|nr:glycoside hydrolase family 88 protein [Pseudacidobacterium sp.]